MQESFKRCLIRRVHPTGAASEEEWFCYLVFLLFVGGRIHSGFSKFNFDCNAHEILNGMSPPPSLSLSLSS